MPVRHGQRSIQCDLLGEVKWSYDGCRVLAVSGDPMCVYVWGRTGRSQEVATYVLQGDRLRKERVFPDLPELTSVCEATREIYSVVQPSEAGTSASDGLTLVAYEETSTPDSRGSNAFARLERPRPYWRLASSANSRVAASISLRSPLGVLWAPREGWFKNLESERLPHGRHAPAIAVSRCGQFVGISRRYASLEMYCTEVPERTVTPTVIECASVAERGALWVEALSLANGGASAMMTASAEGRAYVALSVIDVAAISVPRADEEKPFWVDRVRGPTGTDPESPDEGWLRVYPTDPRILQSPSREYVVRGKLTASDVDADSRTFSIATTDGVVVGCWPSDDTEAPLAVGGIRTTAESVRLGRNGTLIAAAERSALQLWSVGAS